MTNTKYKIGLISAWVFTQCAFGQVTMDVVGNGGSSITGGSVKVIPKEGEGAFYIINDDDENGSVELVDWNGNPLEDGLYIIEIRGKNGSIVRTIEVKIADNQVFEERDGQETVIKATEPENKRSNALVIGGVVAAAAVVGALASSGKSDGGGGGDKGDTTDVDMSGNIDCQVSADEHNHAPTIGIVGGASTVRIQSGSMRLNMPVSGAIAYFTGTYGAEEFRVTEYATVIGFPNTEMIADGSFSPTKGIFDFALNIGSNGSFGDATGQVGITYTCSGSVSPVN